LRAAKIESTIRFARGARSLGARQPEGTFLKTRVRRKNTDRALDSTSPAVAVDVKNKTEGGCTRKAYAVNPELREVVERGIKTGQLLCATISSSVEAEGGTERRIYIVECQTPKAEEEGRRRDGSRRTQGELVENLGVGPEAKRDGGALICGRGN
jgi:hypothetical protein